MNPPRPFDRKALLLSVIFIFIIIFLSGMMSIYLLGDKSIDDAMLMINAALLIDDFSNDPLDYDAMIKAGRKAMFDRLDRYSGYVSDENFDILHENLSGGYTGFGITIQQDDKGLQVISTRRDGSAAEAGIMSGDIITAVDSVDLKDMDGTDALEHLRGKEGTNASLTVYRPLEDSSFTVDVERRRIEFLHIPFAGFTSDSMIYIRLLDFDPGASDDLKSALDTLLNKNEHPKGLILDLRSNPGGLFVEARKTADLFLKSGTMIVGNDSRSRWEDEKYYASNGDITDGLPMAVLVNNESASAAEIVSGALKYAGRAYLVGDTTFGKGLVQGFVRFPDGDGLKLTISRYYFEGGIYLNEFDTALVETGHGIPPDFYYKDPTPELIKLELEQNNILRRFASLHQDEIIMQYQLDDSLSDHWIYMLTDYMLQQGDSIKTVRSILAEEVKQTAIIDSAGSEVLKAVDQLLKKTYEYDREILLIYKDYVKYRLAQIAFERSEGIYESYRRVDLRHQQTIKIAADYIMERKND